MKLGALSLNARQKDLAETSQQAESVATAPIEMSSTSQTVMALSFVSFLGGGSFITRAGRGGAGSSALTMLGLGMLAAAVIGAGLVVSGTLDK